MNKKMIERGRSRRADQRIVEACKGRNVDIDTASPEAILRAYTGWVLGDEQWAGVILSVAKAAGYKITEPYVG